MHSENAQVHTVFLFCSGGQRRVKCIRPELEMELSKKEERGVVRFLVGEGAGTRKMHRRIFAVYGEHCMSLTSVHERQKRLSEARTSLLDDGTGPTNHYA